MTPLIKLTFSGSHAATWVNPSLITHVTRQDGQTYTILYVLAGGSKSAGEMWVLETPEQINTLIRGGTIFKATMQPPLPAEETTNEI